MRGDNGNRTDIITARRMISGLVLKDLKGKHWVMLAGKLTDWDTSTNPLLTVPNHRKNGCPNEATVFSLILRRFEDITASIRIVTA